jgi:glycosyltransferase involved in cell wall biosynthesis
MKPLVSVCMITYNHEKYVAQAIDSTLSQQTNFDYEIVIGEDCSTDRTREICLKYHKKYGKIVKLLENEKNIGMMQNFIRSFNTCKGKYIALLEGDDYWLDPYKLQKEVDILEAHPEYSMVFTARNVVDKDGTPIRTERDLEKIYKTKDVVEGFIPPTQTIVMRKYQNLADFVAKNSQHPSGDRLIAYFCSLFGDIFYLDEITSAYRESGEGVWSSFDLNYKRKIYLFRLIEFHKILGSENKNLIIVNEAVREFVFSIKLNLTRPQNITKNFSKWYKEYLQNIPLVLIIYAIINLVEYKLIKINNKFKKYKIQN